ncbi:hypothetical protein [Granulicella pectinivorans]|uniref:hypothetical protein n=1 Tax=Granulicella pectinivorans TaxID=474950 RepID=UPI000B7EA237|nr:hypothetical protein [Granulicella pectinivorans]
MEPDHAHHNADVVQLPSPTAWPMVLALGISLICAGMVTNIVVGLLGLLLTLMSSVGWFLQVLPREQHESIPVDVEEVRIVSSRTLMERLPTSPEHRKILPIETFHIVTGLKGGIAGGIAMTIPAALFSVLRYHSVWYAANLLAAGGFVSWAGASDAFLSEFHLNGLLAAMMIHGLTSMLVGLLYGSILPMYPRHPIVTAGITVPLLFTGIIYSALGIVSPILNARIDWFWFVASQIAFGLVCGYVVNRHTRIRTPQFRALPFSVRAGVESDQGAFVPIPVQLVDEKDTPQ